MYTAVAMSGRETMDFDVIVVGGGPCGLAASIRLAQLGQAGGRDLNICLLEKGAEIGAHIVSGAVLESRALDELLPGWREQGAPPATPVSSDDFHFLLSPQRSLKLPGLFIPHPMRNHGNYIVSLGALCRWLGEQAENLGVNVFPGYPASEVLYENGRVAGVATGEMGRARDGVEKSAFEAGMELRAPYTIFAEGCRGSLGKELMERFELRRGQRSAALRYRDQGNLEGAGAAPPAGGGGAYAGLAAFANHRGRRVSLPRARRPDLSGLHRGAELQQSPPGPVRGIPALEASSAHPRSDRGR